MAERTRVSVVFEAATARFLGRISGLVPLYTAEVEAEIRRHDPRGEVPLFGLLVAAPRDERAQEEFWLDAPPAERGAPCG